MTTATPLVVTVLGTPRPQGSHRLVAGRILDDNPGLRAWRQRITHAARTACTQAALFGRPAIPGPVLLAAEFRFPAPARSRWPHAPAGPPDLDKLLRAVCDALTTADVWEDDARVVGITASKSWTTGPAGVRCTITPWEQP